MLTFEVWNWNNANANGGICFAFPPYGLPFLMVYPGFKVVSWHHSLRQAEFDPILRETAGSPWDLQPVHHLLWRAELRRA
jgi:hypothetical protein